MKRNFFALLAIWVLILLTSTLAFSGILGFEKIKTYDKDDNLKVYVFEVTNETNMYLKMEIWMLLGKEKSDGTLTTIGRAFLNSFVELKPREKKTIEFEIDKNVKFDRYKFTYLLRVGVEPERDV